MNNDQPQFDQKRFIVAMLLSGAILVVWQIFFAPEPPPPPKDSEVATQTTGEEATDGSKKADGQKTADKEVDVTEKVAEKADADDTVGDEPVVDMKVDKPEREQPDVRKDVFQTEKFKVTLSNRGGRVTSVEIIEPDQYSAEGNLLKKFPPDSPRFPYGVAFAKDSVALPKNIVYEVDEDRSAKKGEHHTRLVYVYDDPEGRFTLEKIYEVKADKPYEMKLEVKLTNHLEEARIADHFALDIFGYKDPNEESSFLEFRADELEALCKLQDDIEREPVSGVDNPLKFDEQSITWGAIDTRYFIFAAVPTDPGTECTIERVDPEYLRTRIVQDDFSIGPGESASVEYGLFAGPKDYGVLQEAGHALQEAVDYGILTFLARPLRWGLVHLYGLVGNWGLAIIILTLIIRGLTWPINAKVYENGERMKKIQPELEKVKEKFKNDQQRQAEETMKIFKENNVSPLGCLPMFLQFPILLALYYMILNSVELYQAEFAFWYTDLSAPDPYYVLPVVMGIVMFVQQSFMTPTGSSVNPQMKTVMKIMPITFTAFMLFLPSGVVLYYSVSLILGLGQQFYIKKKYRTPEEA